jgi:hypothetical protein
VDTFLGLNNLLNPASAEYREGMAYRAQNCRLNSKGLWEARPKLSTTVGAPTLYAFDQTGWGTGNHFKNVAVQGTDLIIGSLATTESIAVGPNEILYGTRGTGTINRMISDGTDSLLAAPTAPTVTSPPADTGAIPTRMENGTYFYIFTSYNSTYKHECIPAKAYQVDVADVTANSVTMTITANGDSDEIRIYRTLRTYVTDNVYNPNNRFYFVGVPTSGQAFVDRLNDQEIINNEYEARGSVPPTAVDYIEAWNNRMYYFKDNIVYWSSAGRPQEVAQEFDLTTETTEGGSTVEITIKPRLSVGVYGEAKYEISELSSKTVTAAIPRGGRLWIFTATTVGYLMATNQLEGIRYKEFRIGIGAVNDKCIAFTPYGVFGADRQGMWLLSNYDELTRISDGAIDLLAGADTTVTQSYVTDSFIVWCPILEEVWWSMQYAADPTYIQIVFQANRGIFTGPYTHAITGGCNYTSTSGAYTYVTGPYIVDQTTADTAVAQYLDFWLGQSNPMTIKDELEVQIIHSATPGAAVTAKIYQADIASTSGITSEDTSYTDATRNLQAHNAGRFFKLELTLPTAGAPLALFNYRYNIAGYIWSDKTW